MATARRQPSTTSLSKFARANSPELSNRSMDFCNAFWGIADGGVDVLFARMRGAARTMSELRAFWKERASIEEDYAKRMSKLAKVTFGKDEIGELRNSIDTIRLETDKQAGYHQTLADQIRKDLEDTAANFIAKQSNHKKSYMTVIEKQFKAKQTQEYYVNQAGEKYKSDCLRINSYTAQSSMMQGKELEKMHIKLERAQQTVQANEKDYQNFARNLEETVARWEQDWKAFCDGCQDLEEERLEFMKDNMWVYANAVSTVCVSDDESCEKIRLALEQMEPEKDMENFVRDYGTGNAIPDPPAFVSYDGAAPSGPGRPTSHPAMFTRTTGRSTNRTMAPPPPEEEETEPVNMVGIGAGKSMTAAISEPAIPISRSGTRSRASNRSRSGSQAGLPPPAASPAPMVPSIPNQVAQTRANDPNDPMSHTSLVIGGNAYPVDPSRDPQQLTRAGSMNVTSATPGSAADPLAQIAKQMKATSSTRRQSRYGNERQGAAGASALVPPSNSNAGSINPSSSSSRNYRQSAEIVVGSVPASRAASPAAPAPYAHHMNPPISISPLAEIVDPVLKDYGQSLPGERKAASRRNSFNSSGIPTHQHNLSTTSVHNIPRPVSREAFAGIGSGSRSASPAVGMVPNGHNMALNGSGMDRSHGRTPPPQQWVQQTQQQAPVNHGYHQPIQNQQQMQQPTYAPPPQGYPPPVPDGYSNGQNNVYYAAASPAPAPVQPAPVEEPSGTGNFTDDGRPILFYVKALYDYGATIEEEFDFQSGDIIAVTATPEDGWWSGELLDDQRRQPNRHVFPSNFVCLF